MLLSKLWKKNSVRNDDLHRRNIDEVKKCANNLWLEKMFSEMHGANDQWN
jgi:hypothetical protein